MANRRELAMVSIASISLSSPSAVLLLLLSEMVARWFRFAAFGLELGTKNRKLHPNSNAIDGLSPLSYFLYPEGMNRSSSSNVSLLTSLRETKHCLPYHLFLHTQKDGNFAAVWSHSHMMLS